MRGMLTALGTAVVTLVAATGASAQSPPGPAQKPANPVCMKQDEETPEIYGPTDIGATVGNGRLSVAVNPEGTLSVLRWPSPSYYDQVKYFTTDRDDPRLGLAPNEGVLSGLALTLRDGRRETLWLRDLEVRQRYASDDSDTVVTRFRSRAHRLLLEVDDVVPPGADVLLRRHVLRLGRGSDVRRARLIAFANLNPTASKRPLLPTEDWCEEVAGTDRVRYDAASDALVHAIAETDLSSGRPASVAIAMGASRASDGHAVGRDHYTGHPSARGGTSAYDDAADGRLEERAGGPAELDGALSVPIGRRRPVTVALAAAPTEASALTLLERWRGRDPVRAAAAKRRDMLRWLHRAPLPRRAPASLRRLSKRALVSLRQAIDERAGRFGDQVAIVASIATQSPYGEDWIRDGAFFNEVLDEIGHGHLVERHNDFYVDVQKTAREGAPPGSPLLTCASPTPAGTWFMTNYADGGDAGLFPWEIDEAAFGLWTLWRHQERGSAARGYLSRVWPAIRETAEFLVAYRDGRTGLTPPGACEDDNWPKPGQPTMHASGPVLLAMRSAVAAAEAMGRAGDAARYRTRVAELERGIEQHHRTPDGAWTADFGDGGWALWPVRVERDYGHPRMRAQAERAWRGVAPAFQAPGGPRRRGQYEVKALHGLAHLHQHVDRAGMSRVKRGLAWISDVQAAYQETGILGESWYVRDGRVISVVAQPHVWEQALVYLAALEAYGRERYRAGAPDRLLRRAGRR